MPAIQNQDLSYKSYDEITQGKYISYLNKINFKEFLSLLILDGLPPCPTDESNRSLLVCILNKHQPLIKLGLLKKLIQQNKFVNSLSYLKFFIDQQSSELELEDVKNLLKFIDNFFQISMLNINLTPKQVNNINQALFDLFASIAKLPETIQISSSDGNDLAISYLAYFAKGYFNKLSKLNANASMETEIYLIYKPLESYLKGLGDLALNFRNNDLYDNLSKLENDTAKLVNSMTSLTLDESSNARYIFLSKYHNAADLLTECKRLFNTTDCDPYQVNNPFKLISRGSLTNFNLAGKILKKILFGSQDDIQIRLKNLSTTIDKNNELANFLGYFKAMVNEANQNNQPLSADYVKDLSSLTFYLTDVFKETKPKSKIYDSLFSLILTLLKNPSIDDHSFWHVWKAIEACGNQMQDLLENPQPGIDSSMTILSSIFHQTSNIAAISTIEKQEIGKVIGELSLACLKIDSCNSFSALNQFSKNLGTMVRSLSKKNRSQIEEQAAKEIETIVQQIFQTANNQLSEPELKGIAWTFLKQRYDKKDDAIQRDCERLFNLNDCHEFISNITMESDFIPTTILPEAITSNTTSITTTTMPTPQIIANITIAPAINQTNPTDVVDHNAVTEIPGYSNDTLFNQTSDLSTTEITMDIARNLGSKLPNKTEIGATVTHSLGSSLLNLVTQGTSIWLRSKGYGESIISAISLSLAGGILQASYMATFPLMLFKLNQLIAEGNEAEAQASWEMMTQEMLPTFFTSLTLSTGLQLLNYLSENYLSKQSTLKGLIQSTPTLSTLWSFSRNPILTGIHTATAYGVSAVGLFGFNLYFGARNHHNSDFELNTIKDVEMGLLNSQENAKTVTNGTTESEITEKTHQYITEEKFNEVKQQSESLLKKLEALKFSLLDGIKNNRNEITSKTPLHIAGEYGKVIEDKEHVLKKIQDQTSTMFIQIENLKDKIHDDADKYLEKNRYRAAMEKLGNVFKLMVFALNTMKTELNGAKGFIEGKSQSFDEISDISNTLKDIMTFIEFPLSTASFYLNKYNQSGPIEAAEKNGAKKALANQEKFNNVTPLRQHKTGTLNRACSLYSDRTHSSGSEEGSVISTESSKDNENAQINRPLLKS